MSIDFLETDGQAVSASRIQGRRIKAGRATSVSPAEDSPPGVFLSFAARAADRSTTSAKSRVIARDLGEEPLRVITPRHHGSWNQPSAHGSLA
jgi:hypothetical protein